MSTRILIADDHPLFRSAMRTLVTGVIDDCHIDEAIDYQETKTALEETDYSLVFLDLNMPDSQGLGDLALLKKHHPQTPIVVVSAHEDGAIIRSCLDHNASGYIIKSASPDSIQRAIRQVISGEACVPEGVSLDANEKPSLAQRLDTLTPSQMKVFIELSKGKLNKQIAYELGISEATVKAHITTVFRKLNINNRAQAVVLAQEHQAKSPTITP